MNDYLAKAAYTEGGECRWVCNGREREREEMKVEREEEKVKEKEERGRDERENISSSTKLESMMVYTYVIYFFIYKNQKRGVLVEKEDRRVGGWGCWEKRKRFFFSDLVLFVPKKVMKKNNVLPFVVISQKKRLYDRYFRPTFI